MVPKHGDSQKTIKDGSKLQRWMTWGDPLEYKEKKNISNVTIRQQIGLEETIKKKLNRTSLHDTAMFKEWQKEDYPK